MPTFDPNKKHTAVGGRPGVAFMQGGYAYNAAKECVGKCNAQGDVEQKKAPTKPPEPSQANGSQQGDDEKALASFKADQLKAIAAEAGIEGAASMNKAALIEAITENQKQGGDEDKGGDE